MGLFGKKKKGTPPPCCGRTPETAVRVGADKTAASVKVLGSGCARCSAWKRPSVRLWRSLGWMPPLNM